MSGKITIAKFVLNNVKARKVTTDFSINRGLVSVNQFDASIYEGEIKTMMKGGGQQLLDIKTKANLDPEVVQTDTTTKEVWELRKEVSELKSLIGQLIDLSKK